MTTPTGVSKLLTELTEQVGFFLFWDEVKQPNQIPKRFALIHYPKQHELNTTKHLLADSVKCVILLTIE